MVNTLPGRDLHRFCWLEDDEIGELPPEWNHLVGIDPDTKAARPALLHYTLGTAEVGVDGSVGEHLAAGACDHGSESGARLRLIVYMTDHPRNRAVSLAFAQGCRGRIADPAPLLPGPVFMYGCLRGLLPTLKQAMAEQRTLVLRRQWLLPPGGQEPRDRLLSCHA